MRDAGWEFVGHGMSQRSLPSEDDPAQTIQQTLTKIEAFTGRRPRGWLGPGLQEDADTPAQLVANDVEFTLHWAIDDLSVWMKAGAGWLLVVPYTLEINDSVLWAAHQYPADELYRRVVNTLEFFDQEGTDQPRVLTLALHPHLAGVPHRLPFFAKLLDRLQAREDTAFLPAGAVHDWYESQVTTGAPPGGRRP
jgi:allantoinase